MNDPVRIHPVIGPALSATSYVTTPVVGATTMFYISVSRSMEPINNAIVYITVKDVDGNITFPSTRVPYTQITPGSYSLTPASRTIFTKIGGLYKAEWVITIPANGNDPELVLPIVNQDMIARSP